MTTPPSSLHLVDPELLPLLDLWPMSTISIENLAARRARQLPLPVTRDGSVSLRIVDLAGRDGAPPIGLHIYLPEGRRRPFPLIYHIHGGGFISGTPSQLEAVHRQLVSELGCALVSVDYRLAPEVVFPGAIEDCYAGLSWVFTHAEDLGLDLGRAGVMGESAGGGLAVALSLMARDRAEFTLSFQHLIYPMLDDRTCSAGPPPFAGEFVWNASNNFFAWRAMLGRDPGGEGISPYAAPARAADLAGLPPTFISVGALDLFAREDLEFAARLMVAGVPVELHLWPGATHGFDLAPAAEVARAANAASRARLARVLGCPRSGTRGEAAERQ